MSNYSSETYAKDLEERVEELEDAIDRALKCNNIDEIIDILEEVS